MNSEQLKQRETDLCGISIINQFPCFRYISVKQAARPVLPLLQLSPEKKAGKKQSTPQASDQAKVTNTGLVERWADKATGKDRHRRSLTRRVAGKL